MKTLAVIADVHGNLPALEAVISDLHQRGIETVVNLGDHASGPLWPRETLELLMQQPWLQIAGNHDRHLVEQHPTDLGASDRYAFEHIDAAQRAWLAALPAHAYLAPDIFLCHGTPSDDSQYLLETVQNGTLRLAQRAEVAARLGGMHTALVLCAHSHIPRVVQVSSTMLVVNPGSVGCPAYIDTEPEHHVVENGSPHAWYAILEQHHAGWRMEAVSLAYDHMRAAQQARRNDRFDWEIALRTGYMQS